MLLSYEYSYLLERLLVFVGGTQAVKVYTLDSIHVLSYEYSYLLERLLVFVGGTQVVKLTLWTVFMYCHKYSYL